MTPSWSIRKQLRTGVSTRPSSVCETPNARTASPVQSVNSGKVRPCEFAQRSWEYGLSRDTPKTENPSSANSVLLSRRSRSSLRQVDVQSYR